MIQKRAPPQPHIVSCILFLLFMWVGIPRCVGWGSVTHVGGGGRGGGTRFRSPQLHFFPGGGNKAAKSPNLTNLQLKHSFLCTHNELSQSRFAVKFCFISSFTFADTCSSRGDRSPEGYFFFRTSCGGFTFASFLQSARPTSPQFVKC